MAGLSAFVQRRWGSWGIFILGLWALVLTLLALTRMLLLSAVVGSATQESISQGLIWTVFFLNALFALGFAASVYGLWSRRQWGRLLFMGCIIIWSVFYFVALFLPGASSANSNYSAGALAFNLIPYIIGFLATIWYLNLPHIKALFNGKESANERISE
ncbi:MAG TPA: hypothetical protein VEC93_18830 [Anaerolineae bacterium]|nr:hypothetical protein [Anaerolineae bacterium]